MADNGAATANASSTGASQRPLQVKLVLLGALIDRGHGIQQREWLI